MWVKICGIRSVESARAAIAAAPDAIGLNFYAETSRVVSLESASEIVSLLPGEISPVGLFVNHPPEDVIDICRRTGIRIVQLHGDETPEVLQHIHGGLPDVQIIRAFRVGENGVKAIGEELKRMEQLQVPLMACLVDAHVKGKYGGTGQLAPWEMLSREYRRETWPPLVLAGGLTPDNVGDAIRMVRPWGVDVAGGVESQDGEKDPETSRQFVQNARRAFAGISGDS